MTFLSDGTSRSSTTFNGYTHDESGTWRLEGSDLYLKTQGWQGEGQGGLMRIGHLMALIGLSVACVTPLVSAEGTPRIAVVRPLQIMKDSAEYKDI